MEELIECPACAGNVFKPFITCTDFTVSKEKFNIVSCSNCRLKFTNPRPDQISIGKYYESNDYISHSNTRTGLINQIYHFVRKRAIDKKIKLIESFPITEKKILDIGCGTGTFLGRIKEFNWQVTGIEPNKKARASAIADFSISVLDENEIENINKDSIFVITMWHVLEHVHQLQDRIIELESLLQKNGYAFIAVPNHTSWDAQHYKEFWAAYDVPRHLHHFSPDVIKRIFLEHNLHHVKSFPMKMDSYYVSMLSEKYKKSFLGLFRAFINGFKSNFKAKNNAEKYSSVIYVFQKK